MCLYVNPNIKNSNGKTIFRTQDPQIATTDIPVYKVLPIDENGNVTNRGVARGFQYKPNTLHDRISGNPVLQARGIHCDFDSSVEEGFHSYADLETAALIHLGLKPDNLFLCGNYNIFKMWIPKGAKYFIGNHNGSGSGYCSDQIRTEELVGLLKPKPVVAPVVNSTQTTASFAITTNTTNYNRLSATGRTTLSNKAKAQKRGPGGRFI